ncbi:prepilin peptidase [Amaricoccus macauensis]|uniref:prepilin peptidase n=1 Tax=Amaricoccus macauensis TaxID=57001 RepID=UPI003C7BED61
MPALLLFSGILVLLGAATCDIRARRIPNVLPVSLALLGVARLLNAALVQGGLLGAGLVPDMIVAFAVFFAGAGLFGAGLLGGGDVKLLAAGSLWLGAARLPDFLFVTALSGGFLAIVYLAGRMMAPRPADGTVAPIRLPYGVAIAMGGIVAAVGFLG